MKVPNSPSPRRTFLIKATALIGFAVLLCAAGWSGTDAAETPRADTAPVGVFDSLVNTSPVKPNDSCAGIAAVRWLPKSQITIGFVRDEFTKGEKSVLGEAINLWERALSGSGLEIVFTTGAEVERDAVPSFGQIIVRRDHQMEEGKYGRIIASARPDNYLDRATILVNGSIHKQKILRKLLLHEMGHALGLRDCADCGSGQSVMNHFSRKSIFGFSIHDKTVAAKPAPADIAQVVNGYRHAAPPQTDVAANESADQQTIVAEENLIAAESATIVAEANILAPYLPTQNGGKFGEVAGARIITSFQAAEFEAAVPKLLDIEAATIDELKNYSFKREVRIQTIDDKGRVSGEYLRVSDMVLDDAGRRVEQNVRFTKPTLRGLDITSQYIEDFSGAQLKGFELDQRDAYRFEPFGFETIDGKAARVYRLTPLKLEAAKARQARVLYGFVWIDEQSGAILKIAGRALPELKQRYPLFETRRQLVDEKHLLPVRTLADDYLVFPSRRVHVRMLITYSNYKRFAGKVNIVELDEPGP